jgi:hypothetical protein
MTNTDPTRAPTTATVIPSTNALILVFLEIFLKCGAGKTVKTKQGRKTPNAATAAPANPETRKPIKPTVMTTGPGVIMATAIESRNCCSHFVITAQCDNANHGSTHTIEYRLHSRRSTFYLPPDRGAYSRSTVFRCLCLGYGFYVCLSFSVHFLVC